VSVNFEEIKVGVKYSRNNLAEIWGYKGYQAIARGVVTPKDTMYIILFVTEEKQDSQEQYKDKLNGSILNWEGPTDHFAEERMIKANRSVDQIHVFHRQKHHSDFTYLGKAEIENSKLFINKPSEFIMRILK
jgi:putative restriction endonuclease